MNPYPTPHLLIAAFFLLMLWTPVLAQEAQDVSDTTLSDEVLRQEVRDAVVTPCVDEAFTEMVKVAGLEEQVTVNDLKHALGPNVVQPTNEFVTNVVKQVRGEPDTVRKGWYKIALGVCMNMVKEKVREREPVGGCCAPEIRIVSGKHRESACHPESRQAVGPDERTRCHGQSTGN